MRASLRWGILALFLAISLGLTVWLWPNGAFLLLVLPFVFAWPRKKPAPARRVCPRCGWSTTRPEDRFCPRDAEPL